MDSVYDGFYFTHVSFFVFKSTTETWLQTKKKKKKYYPLIKISLHFILFISFCVHENW